MDGRRQLEVLALRQVGLVTRRQLVALGCSRRQIELLVRSGFLVPVRRSVYRLCGATPSWRMSAMAAVLAAGPGAVLSHRSAGVLWGLLEQCKWSGPLEIAAPQWSDLQGVVSHRGAITPGEKTSRFGIPVTTAERTLLDLANSVTADELGRLCDEALRRRVLTMSKLRAVLESHGGPGRRKLKPILAVLSDRIPGYDPGANDWELKMDRMWDQMGLPEAERQYRIRIGRRSYRLDRAIVDLKIAVEWNGFDPHGRRGNVDRDSDRRAALAAGGWYPLDFTSRSRPEVICRTVLAVVDERRRMLRGASPAPTSRQAGYGISANPKVSVVLPSGVAPIHDTREQREVRSNRAVHDVAVVVWPEVDAQPARDPPSAAANELTAK
jgi:very-short-patch-repair endonuclease